MAGSFVDVAIRLIHEEPGLTAAEYARIALDRALTDSLAQDPITSFCATLSNYITRRNAGLITRRYENGAYHYYPEAALEGVDAPHEPDEASELVGVIRDRRSAYFPEQTTLDWPAELRPRMPWPPGIASLRKLIGKALDDTGCATLSPLEQYLLGVVACELGRSSDALVLFDVALRFGLEARFKERAEALRAICELKAGENGGYR